MAWARGGGQGGKGMERSRKEVNEAEKAWIKENEKEGETREEGKPWKRKV